MSNPSPTPTADDNENVIQNPNACPSPPRVTAVLMADSVDDADMPTVSVNPSVQTPPSISPRLEPPTVPEATVETPPSAPAAGIPEAAAASEVPVMAAELVDIETGQANDPSNTLGAEFVSATFLKKSEQESLGFQLTGGPNRGDIFVESVDADGFLHGSPIKAGYKIVSINGKNSFDLDAETAAALLCSVVGTVTIVAHNTEGGNPRIAATMVEKPSPSSRVGLGLRQNGRALEVTKVKASGLFAHSLLNVGDRVLFINQVESRHLDATAAIEIIQGSPKYVTLVTEIQSSVGVVLAAAAERTESSASIMGGGVATAVAYNLSDEMRGYHHNFCYCMWMIIVSMLVIGVVVTRVGA